ncbi:hypothetical protein C8R43DRAFT_1037880 [Mycena crocata]|nr:hypothetical protein C8R43DRAFT_1037844 [Mycena crocata]KAJ7116762.1 hypothetical protein C8R43DRAFT_1037863 [Mycena crocata]KAJ7116765.1 hypothetical protein C8R43DRAFT_1037880 [Mycena crocata]
MSLPLYVMPPAPCRTRAHSACSLPALDLTHASPTCPPSCAGSQTGRPAACPRTNTACPPFLLNCAPVAPSILRRADQSTDLTSNLLTTSPTPAPQRRASLPVHHDPRPRHQSVPSHCLRSRTRPRARESAPRAECAAACWAGSHLRHATDTRTRAESRRGEPQRLARPPRRGPRAATSIRRAVRLGEKTKAVGPPQPAPCACQAIEAQRRARCAATAISCPPPLTSPFRPRSPICVSRPRTNPIYQRLDCVRTRSLHRCGRAQVRSAECEREASVAVRSRGSRLKRGSRCACSSTVVSTQLRSTQLRLPGGDSDPVHAEVESTRHVGFGARRRDASVRGFEAPDDARGYSPSTQHDRRVPGRARVESRKWRRRVRCVRGVNGDRDCPRRLERTKVGSGKFE